MNVFKTGILFFVLTALVLAGGYALGREQGLIYALVVAGFMNFIGYFYSDRIALMSMRAEEVGPEHQLYQIVGELAERAGLPMPRVYISPTEAPNAFATGRNPQNAVICVTTGLLQKMDRAELEGVVAHEMSHIKNFDIRLQTLIVVMVGVIALLSDWILRSFLWGGRGRRVSKDKGGAGAILIVVGLVLAVLAPLIATLIRLAVSRKREFLADADGAMLTRYPAGLASALRKIAADTEPLEAANKATAHLYIANPLLDHGGRVNKLFSTHPPIEERIAILEKM
jgi:heat shock protein HtpX